MKDSLGREPRWNADRCAPLVWGRGRARRHGRRALRLSAFRLRYFSFSFAARVERSEPRERTGRGRFLPDFALLNSGYRFCEAAVAKIKAGTTTYLPSSLRDRGVA